MTENLLSHQQFEQQRQVRLERYYHYIVISLISIPLFAFVFNIITGQTQAAILNGTAGSLFLIYTYLRRHFGWKLYFITGFTAQFFLTMHSILVMPGVYIESGLGVFTMILPLFFRGSAFNYFLISNTILFHLPLLLGFYEEAFETSYLFYLAGFVLIYYMKEERDLAELQLLEQQQQLSKQVAEIERLNTLNLELAEKRQESDWLTDLSNIIQERMADFDLKIEDLAMEMEISRTQLFRKVKDLADVTPNQYLTELRLQAAHQLLENGKVASVKSVHLSVGIRKGSYFTKLYKERFGILPSERLLLSKNGSKTNGDRANRKNKASNSK